MVDGFTIHKNTNTHSPEDSPGAGFRLMRTNGRTNTEIDVGNVLGCKGPLNVRFLQQDFCYVMEIKTSDTRMLYTTNDLPPLTVHVAF